VSLNIVSWATVEPVPLAIGPVSARGNALPQVRDPGRAAAHGDDSALVRHIQRTIVRSLAEVLRGMEPSADQLASLRDDMASLVLVSANMTLAAAGVTLLDLNIVELTMPRPAAAGFPTHE
jgi:hypothetical protein